MKATLIISGKSGSGKDAAAQFMKEELAKHGKRVLIIHYGDAVKWFCKEFLDWDGDKNNPAGRTLLQQVGTNIVRAKHPNFWTGIVVGLIQAYEPYDDFDVAIIPDARFPNEVDISLRELKNSVSIRIERKNKNGSQWINPILTASQQQHPSETSLDHYAFDYILHNEGDLEELKEGSITILKDLKLI